jgi:hypothetical protein
MAGMIRHAGGDEEPPLRSAACSATGYDRPQPLLRQKSGPKSPVRTAGASASSRIKLEIRTPSVDQDKIAVSVIIPLAASEAEPEELLSLMPVAFEIILAHGGTRASSMNAAAVAATGRHLWFVHADTTLDANAVEALAASLQTQPGAVHYFDLRFDAGLLMWLTARGVSFRSRVFGLPFGDQALCLPAGAFRALGGYDENVTFGEDHLLVRKARRAGLPITPVGATVTTSARKYRDNGWLRTTLKHWRLTLSHSLRAS